MKTAKQIPSKLLELEQTVYLPCNLSITDIVVESEGKEYGTCKFTINNKSVLFKIAKITPTKIGQFVTLWKRSLAGPIVPFDIDDHIDFFIITVLTDTRCGQFVFPKTILIQQDCISKNGKGGKLAMRVYPPWDKAINKQAIKTQSWQLNYFFEISTKLDQDTIKKLFS